ncbi:DNA-directed DNA/RNA polymerase mu isoform X1 [Gadus morhua]|uniref:DNA-directed DNA/RNA polymerase mu isoform X1 n=1 Tax=Gadus morhua TaxID=8049 RepID=UPI0011B753C8|nr:DNA-directed DNA/RNA polymerase mu isoform X1 [Gadus morhua]
MVPLKRRKVASSNGGQSSETDPSKESRFPQAVIFILERRMGASRRTFLAQLGRSKGFRIEDTYSESVTYIISENNSGDEVRTWLGVRGQHQSRPPVHLLDISWYTESMREGLPVAILDRHRLQEQQGDPVEAPAFLAASYACQRNTPQPGHNTLLTAALSVLAESAELNGDEGRGLAFRRSEGLLRSLDRRVQGLAELRGLPCLGDHSRRVIQDLLENGVSSEVEETKSSPRYKAMKLLTGIFGVGVKTAKRWFTEGICSLAQLETSGHSLNAAQQAGLKYYTDLNQPVSREEADAVSVMVEGVVHSVLPGARVTLAGGFRRGKMSGHDVDFLITHPDEGKEEGLIHKIIACLESRGLLLYQQNTRNTYRESAKGAGRPSSSMDRFERCFSIFKLTNDSSPEDTRRAQQQDPERVRVEADQTGSGGRPWRAVRVDLVVSPISQFAFALLGWTGSKLFERETRRWAVRERSMSLSSHALYDRNQERYLRASSEEEIFAHLGLEYVSPTGRNA